MPSTDTVDSAPNNAINNGATVLDMVRKAMQAAENAGEEKPGRVALRQLTGATDHQIQKALAVHEYLTDTVDSADKPAETSPLPGGRWVALAGFLFGSLVSVAANVLAAWIAPAGVSTAWRPTVYAQFGAAVWPLGLLIAVEVLSRVRWPSGWLWNVARFGGVVVVALGSAAISYTHIHAVLLSWGYNQLGAGVGPLVIDGLMAICGFAMIAKPADTVDSSAVKA